MRETLSFSAFRTPTSVMYCFSSVYARCRLSSCSPVNQVSSTGRLSLSLSLSQDPEMIVHLHHDTDRA